MANTSNPYEELFKSSKYAQRPITQHENQSLDDFLAYGVTPIGGIEQSDINRRANLQPLGEIWANGAKRMLGTAGSSAIENTLGLFVGSFNALQEKDPS